MATTATKVGITGMIFGIDSGEEGSLITSGVSVSKRIDKKELRGRQGGYKAITSYNSTAEVSIDGALVGPAPGSTGFTLGASHTLVNDDLSVAGTLYVEEVGTQEQNEDHKTASIRATAHALI